MLNVQNYLKNNTLESLCEEFAIKAKRHPKYPQLIHFSYSQIHSDFNEKIVRECRGLILDESKDWSVVFMGYEKFLNYGETGAAKIDWVQSWVTNKADGTFIGMWYNPYSKEWEVSTTGTPDAGGEVGDTRKTFRELFWEVWTEVGYKLPDTRQDYYGFCFELMTPLNRVVVRHNKNRIVLHGGRDRESLKEFRPHIFCDYYGWDCVEDYDFGSMDLVIQALVGMKGEEQEGFVICDHNYNRIKMKCEDYLRKHHTISTLTTKSMLNIIRFGESSEILSQFPEYLSRFNEIKDKYNVLVDKIIKAHLMHSHIKEQKDFALQAAKYPFSGILFALRAGKVDTVKEALANMKLENLERML